MQAEWAALISTVINVGFAGAVGWYLLTKGIPKLLESFRLEMKDRREEYKAALDTVILHCEKESKFREASIKSELGLVASTMQDQREVLEELRDAIRELKK